MLRPLKKRKLHVAPNNAPIAADDDLDDSSDTKPDWHASFNLESRAALVLDEEWVREAQDVSRMLRARELNHVLWWDVQAVNPLSADIYGIPHLNYTHESGVVDFSVPPACCQPLAS